MERIPAPEPWRSTSPIAAPPSDLVIYQVPTGVYETRAVFAVQGGSLFDKRQFAATAVLIRHPAGDLLIDAGFGADVTAHIATLPRFERARYSTTKTVSEQLDSNGYDRSRLLGVLLTHSHWDHVSGLDSLDVPVLINSRELEYATQAPGGKVYRAVSRDHAIDDYALDGPPYLGFPASFDFYGDGSVVIALAGGHTTGSVVVFVTLASGQRYAFIGDLTWQLDGIRRRVERPWLMRKVADVDPAVLRARLHQVIALENQMQIVPAHDRAAYAGIPELSTRLTSSAGTDPPR